MAKEIPLTQGKVAIVDDDDFERLSHHKWHISLKGYARRSLHNPERKEYMHRVVIGASEDENVDHINRDRLDNRKCNLRLCSDRENCYNRSKRSVTSQYKGVTWNKRNKKWQAQITIDGKNRYLGLFVDEADAARAYDKFARQHQGRFANLNFPTEA